MNRDRRVVHVNVPGQAYEVIVQPGLLPETGSELRRVSQSAKVGLVTDEHVAALYLDKVLASLCAAGIEPIVAKIPAGEAHKNLHTIKRIYDAILPAGIDRATPIIALGGGVVGDMAGFVAATVLRGVPFVQIPTTLLSMVDASVGGKTGIDHHVGKNLIGAFHQPAMVLIDPVVLRTLPVVELRCGLAECIKHQIIRDAGGFAQLECDMARILGLDIDCLAELVARNVGIKARIVENDPLERGERAHLNFGHTFGHAIEAASAYQMPHGECVALGMVAASRMAQRLGMLDGASVQRIENLIAAAQLPTGGLRLESRSVVDAMLYDKKIRGGRVRFVLPTRIGAVTIRDDVPEELVLGCVESLREAGGPGNMTGSGWRPGPE